MTGPAELMVVGDADQSIYAFRGANIRNILDFEKDFPNARTILLEQNYRSTQTILTAANAVISRNDGRKPKNLWTDAGAGEGIVGYVGDDEHDEARFVAEEVDKLTDAGHARAGDVAVFYRTNAQSRVFEEIFIRVGMPYRVVGGVRFYERREVRDALAYLRVLVNPADSVSLRRILNTPKRGIGERAEACIESLAQRDRITFWEALQRAEDAPGLASRSLNAITGFVDMIEQLQQMVEAGERVDVVLEQVLTRSGYLKELEDSEDPQDETRVENLAELVAVAREFADDPVVGPVADPADPDIAPPGLSDFLERVALVADSDQIPDAPEEGAGASPGRGHPDDAAHGQGPGVPRRLPHRPRGRRLPAHALPGRQARARGGAPARLRRADPRPRAALRLAGRRTLRLGRPVAQPGLALRRRAPGRPRRLAPHGRRDDLLEPPAVRPARRARPPNAASVRRPRARTPRRRPRPSRPIPSLDPGDRVQHDTLRPRAPWSRSRVPAPTTPSPRSTSAPTGSSGCCCATRRSRSCSYPAVPRFGTNSGPTSCATYSSICSTVMSGERSASVAATIASVEAHQVEGDVVRVAKVEDVRERLVADGRVGHAHLLEASLPLLELRPRARDEAEVVEPGRQLGERAATSVVVPDQGQDETGVRVHADPSVADVHDRDEVEQARCRSCSLRSRSVTVSATWSTPAKVDHVRSSARLSGRGVQLGGYGVRPWKTRAW